MPEPQPVQPVAIVDTTAAKGPLGTNANTALQYGQFGILLTALTVGGPLAWSEIKSFHTSAVERSVGEQKSAREEFTKKLDTILIDSKAERREFQDRHEKQSEKVWGRVGRLTDSLDASTREVKDLTATIRAEIKKP